MSAAGVILISPVGHVLLLRRSLSDTSHPGEYDLPGGGDAAGESPGECARRECTEETGYDPGVMVEVCRSPCTDGDGEYTTHAAFSPLEFDPRLSDEHESHVWAEPDWRHRDLHPGLVRLFRRLRVHT